MNIIKFLQTGGIPFDADTINFIQSAYTVFNAFGSLAGDKTIISGCNVVGSQTSDGYIFYNGELLVFKGGVNQSSIIIVENDENLVFENGETHTVEQERYATFGTGTAQIVWSSFIRIENLLEIATKVNTNTSNITTNKNSITTLSTTVSSNKTTLSNEIKEVEESIPEPATNSETTSGTSSDKFVTPAGLSGVLPDFYILSGEVSSAGSRISYKNKSFTVTKTGTGLYNVTHNFGSTKYGVTGSGVSTAGTIKFTIKSKTANSFIAGLSDDSSLNDSDFVFFMFKN